MIGNGNAAVRPIKAL
ncbi:hypothetical protein VCHC62B1_3183A, partial [Vibrio cholerae HC-62B1]